MRERIAQRAVLSLAGQCGYVVTRSQVIDQGVHPRQLAAMIESGVLVRLHRGVFAVGARSTDPLVVIRAAVTYAGPGVLASHQTAAWLQGLAKHLGPRTHVTMPTRSHRGYEGLHVHWSDPLPSLSYKGIRCTTPARTIVDIAPGLTRSELNGAIDKALTEGLTRPADLAREAEGRRRGCGLLRRSLLELGHVEQPDASVLEAEFRRVLTRAGLPAPETQVRAGPDGRYRVDSMWEPNKVVAELYGYAHHHSPEQLDYDSSRQRQLVNEGWRVLIFTWKQVFYQSDIVVRDLRRALEPQAIERQAI